MSRPYRKDYPAILSDLMEALEGHYHRDDALVRDVRDRATLRAEQDGDTDLAEELRERASSEAPDFVPGDDTKAGPVVVPLSCTTIGGMNRRVEDTGERVRFPLCLDHDGRVVYASSEDFRPYIGCKVRVLLEFTEEEGADGGVPD